MSPEPRRLHRAAIGVYVVKALREGALPLVVLVALGAFRQRAGRRRAADRRGCHAAVGTAIAAVTRLRRWSTTTLVGRTATASTAAAGCVDDEADRHPAHAASSRSTSSRAPVQRLFGVQSVHVQTGGGGASGEIVLEAISDAELDGLRRADRAPGRPGREARRSGGSRAATSLLAALTAGQLGVILPVLAGAAQLAQNVAGNDAERDAIRLVPHAMHEWVLAAAALLVLAWLLSVAGAVVAFSGFTVTRDGERLRIVRGLLERREATVPVERVRAVRGRRGAAAAAARARVAARRGDRAREGGRRGAERCSRCCGAATCGRSWRSCCRRPRTTSTRWRRCRGARCAATCSRRPSRGRGRRGRVGVRAGRPVGPGGGAPRAAPTARCATATRAGAWPAGASRSGRSGSPARPSSRRAAARESHTIAQTPLQRRGDLADLEVAFGKRTVARLHHLEATDARDLFNRLAGAWGSLSDPKTPAAPGRPAPPTPADA